ncbi:unnamed protein product [Aureobasidium mustum]|uniref:Uncharacterized protein n=1 Tax=Aureobasidium mustum TaxID=2773714 RepID=A0A9N8PEB9_9PEZI|nr:unnamed protein product [Aureobasidium mustum]
MAGLKTIIALSFVLVATYVIAPVPNWICSRAQSSDDFMDGGSNAVVELGRFVTGFLVVMGVGMSLSYKPQDLHIRDAYISPPALPIVLAHTGQINVPAAAMSIAGGLLIYSTIISFSLSFREDEEF